MTFKRYGTTRRRQEEGFHSLMQYHQSGEGYHRVVGQQLQLLQKDGNHRLIKHEPFLNILQINKNDIDKIILIYFVCRKLQKLRTC